MQRNFTVIALLLVGISLLPQVSQAQGGRRNSREVITQEVLDDPLDIRKLFIGLVPVYSDLWATNVTWGGGADAMIYPRNKLDGSPAKYAVHLHARTTYSQGTDLTRYVYQQNYRRVYETLPNLNWYTYLEMGGEYHFYDDGGQTDFYKFPVVSKNDTHSERQATVNQDFEGQATKRTVVTGRLGMFGYQSAVDLEAVATRRGLNFVGMSNLFSPTDSAIETSFSQVHALAEDEIGADTAAVMGFTNLAAGGFYLGTSMRWNWNTGIEPQGHEYAVLDAIVTGYADFLVAPFIQFEQLSTYNGGFIASPEQLSTTFRNMFGGRAGIDLAFNREFGWGITGECGYRPGVKGSGFYMMAALRFPVMGTDLKYTRESFSQ